MTKSEHGLGVETVGTHTSSSSTECFSNLPRFKLSECCFRICTRISSAFRLAAAYRAWRASTVGLQMKTHHQYAVRTTQKMNDVLGDWNLDSSIVIPMRHNPRYIARIQCRLDVFDSLLKQRRDINPRSEQSGERTEVHMFIKQRNQQRCSIPNTNSSQLFQLVLFFG